MKKVAVLVDGEFFLKRYRAFKGPPSDPEQVAKELHHMCVAHMYERIGPRKKRTGDLYRIFVYDCPPLEKRVHHPIGMKAINFAKSEQTIFRNSFHSALKRLRKVALRLGYLNEKHAAWTLADRHKFERVLRQQIAVSDLEEADIIYKARQKGVDMRIGLDIASLAFKKQVEKIVLVSGDSDFVPAAKLARREGIDFVLDPMWNPISPDLHEHIDGLHGAWPNPRSASAADSPPSNPACPEKAPTE